MISHHRIQIRTAHIVIALVSTAMVLGGCAEELATEADGLSAHDREYLEEYGQVGPYDLQVPLGKEDSTRSGPRGSWSGEVWSIDHQWLDVTTEESPFWSADSGLTWEQKYQAWVGGLETTTRTPSGTTFAITTPYGVTLPAPSLECAEVAIFLRVAFASWYHLPFYMGASSHGRAIYIGHFGFRYSDGSRFGGTPNFSRYTDYTGQWAEGQDWPSDSRLRSKALYGGDDLMPFIPDVNGETAHAGAYFDALFLNKRTAHLMLVILPWFGSINLAADTNMYHIRPEAIQAGDVLLHRWKLGGIGHTIPIMGVEWPTEDNVVINVASGSMPRRQPLWEEGASVLWYFTSEHAGGVGENEDGQSYARMGGGIRRWRTPILRGGVYRNTATQEADFIATSNTEAIRARGERWGQLLRAASPAEMVQASVTRIEQAREHLSLYPASCAARERRERGYTTLYETMQSHYGRTRAQVDAQYRTLSDYVFAELEYDRSRSCCWNSSSNNMYEIIMDLAQSEQTAATASGMCQAPTVFMGRNNGSDGDGFQLYAAHAQMLGRADEWVPWSADESCPQSGTANDVEKAHVWTPYCELGEVSNPPAPTTCEDGDDHMSNAPELAGSASGRVCNGTDVDIYRIEVESAGIVEVELTFQHTEGDLDLALLDADGTQLTSSQGTSNREIVAHNLAAGTYFARVFGYSGATADYAISLNRRSDAAANCTDAGQSTGTAVAVGAGRTASLRVCAGETEYWLITPSSASTTVRIDFQHSLGDLDVSAWRGAERIASSDSTENFETLQVSGNGAFAVQVFGYGGAVNDYSLTVGE